MTEYTICMAMGQGVRVMDGRGFAECRADRQIVSIRQAYSCASAAAAFDYACMWAQGLMAALVLTRAR